MFVKDFCGVILNVVLHVQRKENYEKEAYSLNVIPKQAFKSYQREREREK